jgi:hypothetical protein
MRLVAVAVVAVVALVPMVAHADAHVVLGYPGVVDHAPVPDDDLRFELAGAFTGGSFYDGPLHGGGAGVLIAGGVRYDRVAVVADLDYSAIAEPTRLPFIATPGHLVAPPALPEDGALRRVGLAARWSLVEARSLVGRKRGPPRAIDRDDLWIEAGVGREHVAWNTGPDLDRPDVAFGIGFDGSARSQPGETKAHAGVSIGLRVILAHDPTDPRAIDHSIIGSIGFAFGN